MLTAVFSLAGALVFGAADFLGGLAAKRVSSILATAVASLTGLVLLLIALPFLGGAWTPHDVFWGVISGIAGAVAISLLYACLAIGPMSILSPLTAVVSAIVPMVWGLLVGGERFATLGYWALGLALVAVVLVGFVPERGAVRPSLRGILMAIGSGEVWSIVMKNAPIAMPEPIAMRMPRRLGRTAPRSGTNPTSTTATSASPSAQ